MVAQICETCKKKGNRCACAPNSTCKAYEPRAITWFEKIKLMDIEEMAEAIYSSKAEKCHFCKSNRCSIVKSNCIKGIKQWLESEVEV